MIKPEIIVMHLSSFKRIQLEDFSRLSHKEFFAIDQPVRGVPYEITLLKDVIWSSLNPQGGVVQEVCQRLFLALEDINEDS